MESRVVAEPLEAEGGGADPVVTSVGAKETGTAKPQPSSQPSSSPARERLIGLLKHAASLAVAEGDPWCKHHMEKIPAERIIRHLYHPHTRTWHTEETIVKMEKQPFAHGAMRWCYRMKKRSPPPMSATNHRFHNYGWTRASNYVAKAYHKDGVVDTSDEAKAAVQNDIMLQYEAAQWAGHFNAQEPPKQIVFIRAYAVEFPDRPGSPWFAVERFIAGHDSYGCGFTKHNTNAGFVDEDLHRVTPQVFSAHSFYVSSGNRLVADIQGVGDLFTDPQVLSSDYRFGDGDLGPRGMALFFKTFRHNSLADALGIPVFPLSKNEIKHQAKFEDDVYSMLSDASSAKDLADGMDGSSELDTNNNFARLDQNRQRRCSALQMPFDLNALRPEEDRKTERRSNVTMREDVQLTLKRCMEKAVPKSPVPARKKMILHRTASDVDEVKLCLDRAKKDFKFDRTLYNRKESGELLYSRSASSGVSSDADGDDVGDGTGDDAGNKHGQTHSGRGRPGHIDDLALSRSDSTTSNTSETDRKPRRRRSLLIRRISDPIVPTDETRINLGKVHYQLAVLHGMGRFPEIVPHAHPAIQESADDASPGDGNHNHDDNLNSQNDRSNSNTSSKDQNDAEDQPSHDSFSVLFHLSHAASLHNVPACLAFGRIHSGLDSVVSDLLRDIVPIDFDASKEFLRRAMQSPYPPAGPKAAAGCLLYQILLDEGQHIAMEKGGTHAASPKVLMEVLEDTLKHIYAMEEEDEERQKHQEREKKSCHAKIVAVGDRAEGNYALEGSFYPGTIVDVHADDGRITIQYDDDGSTETLDTSQVRPLIPPTATQTNLGGPLSDEEALGCESSDDKCMIPVYQLQAELADLKAEHGNKTEAAMLYQQAADRAIADGKMKSATEWSLKAADIEE